LEGLTSRLDLIGGQLRNRLGKERRNGREGAVARRVESELPGALILLSNCLLGITLHWEELIEGMEERRWMWM
jgi:hypothetical protein